MPIKKDIAISESGFLFNPETGDSYSLNPIAVELFKMLQEQQSDDAIAEFVMENYLVDRDTLEKDLYDFKQMLGSYKLIRD